MQMSKKRLNLKKIFLLAVSLSLCSCKFNATGLTPTFLDLDMAKGRKYPIIGISPIKVSGPIDVDIKEMNGWVCFPPDQAQKVRRAYDAPNQSAPIGKSQE